MSMQGTVLQGHVGMTWAGNVVSLAE